MAYALKSVHLLQPWQWKDTDYQPIQPGQVFECHSNKCYPLLRYLHCIHCQQKEEATIQRFIKVIHQEQYSYEDPITEFLACIYVNYDFDEAQKRMKVCEEVILNDPFLGKRVEGSFTTVPLRDEF